MRVTANDGEIGEQFLREFQDNEKGLSMFSENIKGDKSGDRQKNTIDSKHS